MPAKDWCNFAYTLVGSSDATVGSKVVASPGSKVKTTYKLNSSTQLWDQNVYIDGTLKSSVHTSKGQKGWLFYISLECASGTCGKVGAHSTYPGALSGYVNDADSIVEWEDVTITLAKADMNFKHSGSWEYKATGGQMSTSDNGKTWTLSTLSIPAMKVPATT